MASPTGNLEIYHAPRGRRGLQRIAWLEPFWILLLSWPLLLPQRFIPVSWQPIVATWRPALLALLALGWPIRWIAYGHFSRRTPIDWPLLFIVLWLPVNFWASSDKTLSWDALTYLLYGIALYVALLNWPPAERRPQLVGWLVLLFGLGLAVIAPAVSSLSFGKLFRLDALETLRQQLAAQVPGDVNANRVGGALVVILPLAVALSIRGDWHRRRWPMALCGLAALYMLMMLVLTQSRGAYLAAAIAIVVVVVLRWPKLRYGVPVVLLILVIATFAIGPQVIIETVAGGTELNGLNGRLEVWSRAVYALSDFPFTGIGIGTWNKVIPVLYPFFTLAPDVNVDHAHNLFLQVGLDLGLPGLIAYLALFINTFAMLVTTLRQRAAAFDWALAAGALGGLVAMFVHGLVDAPIWGSKPAFIPWLLVALSMQVGLHTEQPVLFQAPLPPP